LSLLKALAKIAIAAAILAPIARAFSITPMGLLFSKETKSPHGPPFV